MKKRIGSGDAWHHLTRTNLNHLVYFWAVARASSISGAAEMLQISQSTVSEQLKSLEDRLGATLVIRRRSGVTLTPAGVRAFRFADEAVGVCSQLVASLPLDNEPSAIPVLRVGTADGMPKLLVSSLLSPLLAAHPALSLECREWRIDHLLAELSLHRLDVVLTDAPIESAEPPTLRTLPAGDSPVVLVAAPDIAKSLRRGFPKSLDNAPMLLPPKTTPMRQRVERWLAQRSLSPRVVVSAEDRGLLNHFAQAGIGALPVPKMIAPALCAQFNLVRVGDLTGCRDEFFVILTARTDVHPSLQLLVDSLARSARR